MKLPGLERVVWPGMVLAGLALAVAVWASWPEPTLRVMRLPVGESMPKTASAARPAQAVVKVVRATPAPVETAPPRAAASVPAAPAPADAEPEAGRVLAAVDPDPATAAAPAWPAPMQSELERSGDFAYESPEDLGAEPLPGAVTPEPAPVAG